MTNTTQTLQGRKALVTGASAGIGRAVAMSLAASGAQVVVSARRQDRLDELVAEIQNLTQDRQDGPGSHDDQSGSDDLSPPIAQPLAIQADASDNEQIDQLWAKTADHFGQVPDLIVVNAGRGLQGSVLTSDEKTWESMFKLNVLGALHLMRLAGNALQTLTASPNPRDLVVLGSVVGNNVSPFSSVYGSTKFAIESAAEGLRREIGQSGVRVTTIKPGIVTSEFQEVAGYDHENFGQVIEKFGQLLVPEDIAECIRFVCAQPAHVHVNTLTVRPVGQDYP